MQELHSMGNGFFTYLQQLEMMAFFSGYPLIYAFIFFKTENKQSTLDTKKRIASLLPIAYALVGTLYLGLQLRNLYPDYTFNNIRDTLQQPFLVLWALLSILFWIPALHKKPVFSLIHSLVFFFFLVRDLFLQTVNLSSDKNIVRNEMKIYTDSLLLNMGAFVFIVLIFFLYTFYKKRFSS